MRRVLREDEELLAQLLRKLPERTGFDRREVTLGDQRGLRRLITMCIGGGQGIATILERV